MSDNKKGKGKFRVGKMFEGEKDRGCGWGMIIKSVQRDTQQRK